MFGGNSRRQIKLLITYLLRYAWLQGLINTLLYLRKTMRVLITSNIKVSADEAWKLVKRSSTLLYVTRGLMGFRPIDSNFPIEWQQGNTEKVRVMLFGIIPSWAHQISFKDISDIEMAILTHESGGVVKTWNHNISIQAVDKNSCIYTDDVEIKAGIFTLLIWLYAHVFYRYRQLRWRFLVKTSTK